MTGIFSQVLNMSMTGSIVIIFVMLARKLMHNSPKIYSYILWSVVLFRLLSPISFASPVSFLEWLQPQVAETSEATTVISYIPVDYAPYTADEDITHTEKNLTTTDEINVQETTAHMVDLVQIGTYTWMTGVGFMLIWGIVSCLRLRMQLVGTMAYQDNVYLSDYIDSPFVMGVVSPKVYLPSSVPHRERPYIIAHEQHHIRRFDHIIKLLAYGALCIHWFNPLVWVAFILAGKDMEMSCDEAVIRKLGPHIRADYSASLLRLATHRRIIAGMPLAFGEGDTKGRVLNMAKWKKPKLWVSVLCLLLCAAVLVACAVNPEMKTTDNAAENIGFDLPEGISARTEEERLVFYKDQEKAGGVNYLQNVDGIIGTWDWVEALGVPENVPEERFMMWVSAEFSPVITVGYGRNGVEETIHSLFEEGERVSDVWFDVRVVSEEERMFILSSYADMLETTVSSDITAVPQVPSMKAELPDGFSYHVNEGDTDILVFTDVAGSVVGGVSVYPIPEGVYDSGDKYFDWLFRVGIPDFQDPGLAYMGGMTSGDYGWLAEFTSDVPEGKEITVDHRHHCYPIGNAVYDIWFDMLKVDLVTSEDLRLAIQLPWEQEPEYMETQPGNEAEELAFQKCAVVMDTVQEENYHILSQQVRDGNEGPKGYVRMYCSLDGDKLSTHTVLTEGENLTEAGEYYNRLAYLSVGDQFFSNEGHQGESGEIIWVESEPPEYYTGPWMERFAWKKANVSYIDTMKDVNGECIMFRVDKMYEDLDGYSDFYFVNFYFDTDGNFLNVKLQVNLFQDNGFTVTESIVTLDEASIRAEIDREYLRAVG